MATKLMVLVGFCVAFAAGVVAGRGRGVMNGASTSSRNVSPSTGPGPHHGGPGGPGWLAKELSLTTEQQEQLRQIWSETATRGRGEREDQRRQLRKEREDAVTALVRPEDKDKFQRIQDTYTQKMEELDQQWRASFDNAVRRTKEILTPDQRTKYEELLKRNQWDRGGGGQSGPRGDRPPGPPGDGPRFGPGEGRRQSNDRTLTTTKPSDVNR
jgi:Spy/CpxP family protein refolding chaperone